MTNKHSRMFKKFKSVLQKAVVPAFRCPVCGVDVFEDRAFCKNCLKTVVFNDKKTCKRCGVALHGSEDYCGRCAGEENFFDRAYSPFSYAGGVQKAILDMKFHNIAVNAEVLARYLADCAVKNNLRFDCVTYVPMTKIAQKQRGYNQAQLLAESFCDIMKVEPPVCLIQKVKNTLPQEKLGQRERKENLHAAFAADCDLHGKTILLIDDIKTTGATLNECAKALKRKNAAKVICLTVASREENTEWEKSAPRLK